MTDDGAGARASTWEPRASLPDRRHDMTSVAHDGEVYVLGGSNEETLATVATYDPSTDAWTERAPMPTPRGWYAAGRVDDAVYVAGGKQVRQAFLDTGEPPQYTVHAAVERYDLAADRWTTCAPLPGPRAGLAGTGLDGRVYVVGGLEPPAEVDFPDQRGPGVRGYFPATREWLLTDRVDVYDPAADAWTEGPALPGPLMAPGVAGLDGRLYVFGGFRDGHFHDEVWALDPATGEWTERAPMPTGRRDFPVVVDGGRAYVFGGLTNGTRIVDGEERETYTPACAVYDPDDDAWRSLPDLPEAVAWAGAARVDGRPFVVGGANRPRHEFLFSDACHELV